MEYVLLNQRKTYITEAEAYLQPTEDMNLNLLYVLELIMLSTFLKSNAVMMISN